MILLSDVEDSIRKYAEPLGYGPGPYFSVQRYGAIASELFAFPTFVGRFYTTNNCIDF